MSYQLVKYMSRILLVFNFISLNALGNISTIFSLYEAGNIWETFQFQVAGKQEMATTTKRHSLAKADNILTL